MLQIHNCGMPGIRVYIVAKKNRLPQRIKIMPAIIEKSCIVIHFLSTHHGSFAPVLTLLSFQRDMFLTCFYL